MWIPVLSRLVLLAAGLTQPGCATAPRDNPTTLQFDYAGAECLIQAVSLPSLTTAQRIRLESTHGVVAMVDNVTRYVPDATRARFESDLRAYLETGDEPRYGKHRVWGFQQVRDTGTQVADLIAELRARKLQIIEQALTDLKPFQPETGPLTLTVYFVTGGVSDGFVTERGEQSALYVNLARAQGDAAGVIANLTHEIYHVMQQAAARRVPELRALMDNLDMLPATRRLLAETLWEGTANYAANPLRSTDNGPYIEMWRSKYQRNMTPERIAQNFQLFDSLLSDLDAQRLSWDEAYAKGFAGPESPLYFVGYEMTRVIDEHCGRACIGKLFQQSPEEFFRSYVALYQTNTGIAARFSAASERLIAEVSAEK